jgi:6,7-dimethyl-8-ribityllumazine synthase
LTKAPGIITIKLRILLIIANFKEEIMIEVTEAAAQQIAEYFKDKEIAPIRIFLNEGG